MVNKSGTVSGKAEFACNAAVSAKLETQSENLKFLENTSLRIEFSVRLLLGEIGYMEVQSPRKGYKIPIPAALLA